MSTEAELWEAVVASNRAWFEGRPRDVAPLFHADAVAVFLAADHRLVGRDAIVESYVQYVERAKTHAFVEHEHAIDVFGDTAVVNYRFSVRYETDDGVQDDVGQELLVFVRRAGAWGVVWRTQAPIDA